MTTNDKLYMRDYMRRRRGSPLVKSPPDWLATLRWRYAAFLAAQRAVNAWRDAALAQGMPGPPPPHLVAALEEADTALERHAAQDPDRAAEYYARHAAHALARDLGRVLVKLADLDARHAAAPRHRGRPARLPVAQRLADTRAALEAAGLARTAAAQEMRRATNRREHNRAHARHAAAGKRADRLADHLGHLARLDAATPRTRAQDAAERDYLAATAADLQREIDALLDPLPHPPRAPLLAPPRKRDPDGNRSHRATGRPRGRPPRDPTGGLA